MLAGPIDFVRNARKGNDSKSEGKAITLKGPLPAAEVYGVLWLPPGSCGALAAETRGDRLLYSSRWRGNRTQSDDRLAL